MLACSDEKPIQCLDIDYQIQDNGDAGENKEYQRLLTKVLSEAVLSGRGSIRLGVDMYASLLLRMVVVNDRLQLTVNGNLYPGQLSCPFSSVLPLLSFFVSSVSAPAGGVLLFPEKRASSLSTRVLSLLCS